MKFVPWLLSSFLLTLLLALPASAQVAPGYTKASMYFGDFSNSRPAPTSGTLTGEYWTRGAWASTGPITCNQCRLHFGSTVTLNNAITGGTDIQTVTPAGYTLGGGGGLGAGGAAHNFPSLGGGGGGGGHGGFGGNGGNYSGSALALGGCSYPLETLLSGSAGATGWYGTANGAQGGAGGGSLYMEAIGNIVIGANITYAGGAGGTQAGGGGGGGGSGGGIDIRSLGTVTINGGITVSAPGGVGGAGGTFVYSGGGGGGGGIVHITGSTVTNNGSVTVAGGTGGAGVGGGVNGDNGAAGVTSLISTVHRVRSPN